MVILKTKALGHWLNYSDFPHDMPSSLWTTRTPREDARPCSFRARERSLSQRL